MRCRASMIAVIFAGTAAFALPGTAIAQDRDCADFSSRQEAQSAFESVPGDPERLDADNDGLACEALESNSESAPAEGESSAPVEGEGDSQAPVGAGDSGMAPTGGVEAGHGGMADRASDAALPLGLTGLALVAAGGTLVLQRRPGKSD
ncbi:hypothetical protein GCM10009854_28750 [Saccharopolyspora halophila]|uniref:Excalibur calcium-binding domain-containing protein n=1 Tax=Saccharopolyspora halophila TaxID=405551 RepID=A0ABN3GDS4_9PSEU